MIQGTSTGIAPMPSVAGATTPPASADHGAAIGECQRLAAFAGRTPGSADLLLGLLRVGGAAARLLFERGATPGRLEAHIHEARPEPAATLKQLDLASREIARLLGARQATSLHLLLAILRTGGAGMDVLRLSGQDPARIRAIVMRSLTGPGRSGERTADRPPTAAVTESGRFRRPQEPRATFVASHARLAAGPDDTIRTAIALPVAEERAGAAPAAVRRTTPYEADRGAPEAGAAESPRSRATTRGFPPAPPSAWTDAAFELHEVAAPANPVVHRERELGRLLDLLRASSDRIACIVGDPGSGRSAVMAALAHALPERPVVPSAGPSSASGGSPGSWLSSMHQAAPVDLPIVLDGCAVLGGDGSDGPAQLLATARMGRRWILLATPADLRRFDLCAPELSANLEVVALTPLSADALGEVIEQGLASVSEAHGIDFEPGIARALIRLAPRYPTDRAQPGRALAIAEIAAARTTRLGLPKVTLNEIASVVADASGTPTQQLLRTDDDRFRGLDARLAERVVGHNDARARIADVLRRSYAGFRGRRPIASLLLLGPTGVGKTETARAIADALYDGEQALIRIDLSEFNEPHSVARLIGSPPGYVGHEDGGQLTEAVRRRPASVVLLDEFEKAHREVLLLLLQILEDGRLTDGRGRTVDFSSSAIVMTSNLGSELYKRSRTPPQNTVLALARSRLPPELWNRIDEVLCYAPLGDEELRQIVARIATASSARLQDERGIGFSVDESVVNRLLGDETDRSLGARPLRRAFERMIEGPIAAQILAGNIRSGARLHVRCDSKGNVQLALA